MSLNRFISVTHANSDFRKVSLPLHVFVWWVDIAVYIISLNVVVIVDLAFEKKLQIYVSWWRHQIETLSALLAICAGNSPVTGEFTSQRPVTRSFDVFFDLRLNKRWSKQSWRWWFETPSRPLWRHCNVAMRMSQLLLTPSSKLYHKIVEPSSYPILQHEELTRGSLMVSEYKNIRLQIFYQTGNFQPLSRSKKSGRLRSIDAYVRQLIIPLLVQIMACRRFDE